MAIVTKQNNNSLFCRSCNREIKKGEKYESTYNGKNAFCRECSKKEVLVYQIPKRRVYRW